ncbi:MAG: ABC transporter ATP-binding protein [Lachnospiraceae bacterium]|nr:ABC transporter ATP-binding protein [Lachnospiraceae bacterium]
MEAAKKLLELNKVSVGFPHRGGMRPVTENVSFSLHDGEILGIVGESGSGKSVSMLAVMGLLSGNGKVMDGSIRFYNKEQPEEYTELNKLLKGELRQICGNEISMIFQEPMTSLNPVMTIGAQVEEMLTLHSTLPREKHKEEVLSMLSEVGLSEVEKLYDKYPHQLSGGMRQRVMIAMAMILRPKLLIADEPTTALDVTIQAKILKLLKKLQTEYGTSIVLISHDLGVIRSICSRTVVMCEGRIVEQGKVEDIFERPQEEYTKRLLAAALGKGEIIEKREIDYQLAPVVKAENYSVFYAEKPKNAQQLGSTLAERLKSIFAGKIRREVVRGVSFEVYPGEIVGIVGESGCGKSTLIKGLAGLNPLTEGMLTMEAKHPQMVFQDPYGSLNPSKTIGWLLTEPLRLHSIGTKEEQRQQVLEMLKKVGLSEEYYDRYPSTLSGGQRQRIAIAMAIMLKQKLILLDEPVSALDVTVQEQILILLLSLRKEYDLSYIFISHDMNVIHRICDRVMVMYHGEIVESGKTEEIFERPQHEYTRKLLKARL